MDITPSPNSRQNPYVGPRAFEAGEQLYGRDREISELLNLVIAGRIVLLYSPSGAGETSLLRAGLIPLLQREGVYILPTVRFSQEPIYDEKNQPVADGGNPKVNRYVFSTPEEAAAQIAARYRVSKGIALEDYKGFIDRIESLIRTPDLDPVTFLDFELATPHSADLSAPLRLDCALTYRLNPDTAPEYAPVKRASRELSTEEWKSILNRAWEFGIPQVTFTGGEATLREDLPELIAKAEGNGQVCGNFYSGA